MSSFTMLSPGPRGRLYGSEQTARATLGTLRSMKNPVSRSKSAPLALALGLVAVAAGCTSPASHPNQVHEPGWTDTGTPARPVSIDRLARYYVDEDGVLWDERGRKYEEDTQ